MVTVHSFGEKFGLNDPSAFVLKLDTYLRLAGIKFESKEDVNNLRIAPKGKLPFILDDNKTIADSYFIIEHLKQTRGDVLDDWLSDEQKALAHLISKSLDENLYWCVVYSRWMSDDVWPVIKSAFFDSLPFPIKHIIPRVARKNVEKNLQGHGLGKHSPEEVFQIADHSLKSLSNLLGDKDFYFGDKMCSLDISVFAHLAQLILADIKHPLNDRAKEYTNLVTFCQRIEKLSRAV
ncbi:glutathione S-transferase family protein [Paraglaciecola sp.]|uniref:glutathione S-transferase family protein n=1 Tax=Paraglaciecola sp. TaxID=1920173 RepID=UPI003EF5F66B